MRESRHILAYFLHQLHLHNMGGQTFLHVVSHLLHATCQLLPSCHVTNQLLPWAVCVSGETPGQCVAQIERLSLFWMGWHKV